MTNSEQKTVDALYKLMSDIRAENNSFKEQVSLQVEQLSLKVEHKHLPLSMEEEIIASAKSAISKSLSEALNSSYNNPLAKYATNIISKYQKDIEAIFDKVIQEGIQTPEFKQRVNEVLLSKIAKTVISGIDGGIDKTINAMKQDAIFRSRLTLAVNTLVDEFLNPKQ